MIAAGDLSTGRLVLAAVVGALVPVVVVGAVWAYGHLRKRRR